MYVLMYVFLYVCMHVCNLLYTSYTSLTHLLYFYDELRIHCLYYIGICFHASKCVCTYICMHGMYVCMFVYVYKRCITGV